MRALLCKQFGPVESLVVEEVPDPTPGPGQVVVDVAGCGVNFPDVLIIQDKYQFKPELPFSPGGEVAGTVSAVGQGVEGLQRSEERRVGEGCVRKRRSRRWPSHHKKK